jgi:SPP1 gp7 family putative phage head morphogenesis protein
MPGPEGKEAAALLRQTQRAAVAALVGAAGPAVERALRKGGVGGQLFNDGEREAVSAALASVVAAGDLLGRVRAGKLMEQARGGARKYGEASGPGIFAAFAEGVPEALPPRAAIDYFKKLVPKLGADPERLAPDLERRAFTLAASTEETLTAKVQDLIARALESGGVSRPAEDQLADLLAAAGVTPQSSGYAEMVVRTNSADAYNAGAWQAFAEAEEEFPAWEYLAVADARSRPHHAARAGKFFPAAVNFNEVRGTEIGEVANCRCSFRPVHRSEWSVLQRRGRGFDSFAEFVPEVHVYAGFTGTITDKNGRKLHYQNGKRVADPDKAKAKAKPEPKAKPTADSVHGEIAALLGSGKRLEKRHAAQVAAKLQTLTVAQMKEVKAKLGVKATGAKAAQAQAIAEKAVAAAREKAKPGKAAPTKPAPKAKPQTAAPAPAAPKPPVAGKWQSPSHEAMGQGVAAALKANPKATPDELRMAAIAAARKAGQKAPSFQADAVAALMTPPERSVGSDPGNAPNPALHDNTRPELTPAEAGAARAYSKAGFDVLNQQLRDGGVHPDIAAHHEALQSAFAKAGPLPEPVTAYRGMRMEPAAAAAFVAKLKTESDGGKHVRIPGYTSTTTKAGELSEFGSAVTLEIEARHGLDLMPHSERPSERELLLNHNSNFEVAGIDSRPDGTHTVRLRQIV